MKTLVDNQIKDNKLTCHSFAVHPWHIRMRGMGRMNVWITVYKAKGTVSITL